MKRTRTADAAPAPRQGTALSLTVTGALMVVTTFLLLNSWFGVHYRSWPWELLADGDVGLRVRALYALALVTGLWALGLSFTKAHHLRSSALIALVAVLIIECQRYLVDIRVGVYLPHTLIVLTVLGAGLLFAREEGTRGIGRVLAGVGAVVFVWSLASSFGPADTISASGLELWWQDVTSDLDGGARAGTQEHHLWLSVLPTSLFLIGAACGVLATLGVAHRLFLLIAFWLIGVGLLAPVGVALIVALDQGAGMQHLTNETVTEVVSTGFLLWLLGAYALFDAARGRMRES